MTWWPADEWAAMLRADGCPMCADETGQETNPHSDLIAETETSWIRLSKNQTQAGYSLVILKRHATELCHLTRDELTGFWTDVAAVGAAVLELYAPVKLDSMVMGHLCPHLHCHIYPQYPDDDPRALINVQAGDVRLGATEQRARAARIRAFLR